MTDSSPADPALGVTRSVTGRRWAWREADARLGMAVAERAGVPELIGRLLFARGVDAEAAAAYLAPTLRAALPDPSCLRDMDAAAERLARAVRANERVTVFADYDVDGACAGALMVRVLRQLGCAADHYVPHRLREGYGPNAAAVGALCDDGASLIVCVDCGAAAHAALSAAAGRACVVVLDHHQCEGSPPDIVATVNPNRFDCSSGLKHLCAAGVAFMAAVALHRVLRRRGFFAQRPEPDLRDLLDLVALATVCDVVPLTGLNRAFVSQGLRVLARRGNAGLGALLDVGAVREAPGCHALGYVLGPRINAGGRLDEPDLGLRLLLTDDPVEARALAEALDAVNRRRKEVESGVLEAALAAAETQVAAGRRVLLVCDAAWHPGVVGIVAGRLKERFGRPCLVAGVAEGMARGSGRSVPGADLGAAVIAARQAGLMAQGGGHAMAAGFAFAHDRLRAVHDFLEARLEGGAAGVVPCVALDGSVAIGAATLDFAEALGRLAPFGAGNEEPVFAVPHARVVRADRVGKEGATVRAFVEGEGGARLKAVCFRAKEGPLAAMLLNERAPLHLAGALRAEQWQDRTSVCLQIEDAAPA